ncbi:MAG: acyltransferase [Clostridiaceae bacterium]|nr:acyltransferase [Clostridiaceae bacterium]
MNKLLLKIRNKLMFLFRNYVFQYPRVIKYKILSDCKSVLGKPVLYQPLLLTGKGKIIFGENVKIGVAQSPYYYSTYCYFDSRKPESLIEVGSNCWVNNNLTVISDGAGVSIGKNTIIGTNVTIVDSDFHKISSDRRVPGGNGCKMAKVVIGENVWIGNCVTVLKGVSIGNNSVVAASAVVTSSVPDSSVVAGNPAKLIKSCD